MAWTACTLLGVIASPIRAGVVLGIYTWFRHSDDVIDGEDPNQPRDLENFIRSKTQVLQECVEDELQPSCLTGLDRVLRDTFRLATKIDMDDDLKLYARQIWKLMLQDHRWRSEIVAPSRSQLMEFAAEQDEIIFGLAAMLMGVSREDLLKFTFWKTGVFTRCDWVSDMERDTSSGLIHVACEDVESLSIKACDLVRNREDSHIRGLLNMWMRSELSRLRPELQAVMLQKEEFLKTFPNIVCAWLYNRCIIRMFEKEIQKVYQKHGVAFAGSPFYLAFNSLTLSLHLLTFIVQRSRGSIHAKIIFFGLYEDSPLDWGVSIFMIILPS